MATPLKSQLRVNTAISATSTSNLVFIDAAIADYQNLANGVIPNTEVFLLEPNQDGIEQITAILANYRHLNLSNIHIIAHAIPGCLYLGNTHLGIDTLDIYQPQLQQWHHNINLLLYGCNVAAGDAGTEFITKLHQLTKANIAASRGRVGSAAQGGNWELDFCTANMEVNLAFTETTRQAYTGVFATFVVNDIGDSDDGDPNNGTTTLREAINLANNTSGTDTITFSGIFNDDIPDTITLTSGQLTITDNVNIIGTKASQLTISGNHTSRVFEISGAGTDAVIDSLNIANGNNSTATFQSGGGILVNANSILSLNNSTVSGNSANRDGGGIFNLGTLSVSNSTVSGNTTGTDGIYSGGGIYNNAAFSLVNSIVSNNSASFGGGIYNPQNRNISIRDSIISGNSVTFYGGGINNEGSLNLSNSTIFDNSARQGGGIYTGGELYYSRVGSATITNSTISGNSASEDGGGIYNYSNVTVINSTIANNTADSDSDGTGSGGGIANDRSATIGNTIIADNFDRSTSGDINPDVYNYDDEYTSTIGQFTDSGNNLIGNQGSNTDFTTSTLVGTNANPIDPKLSPLQNNGGNTLTHALQTGSPAINAGNNFLVPANTSIDQRGADRIADSTVDIGAYEDGSVNNPITTADTVVTNTNDSGVGSLRQALLNANANAGEDIITFAGVFLDDVADIINLTSGQLTITDDVTIMGTGASQLTISGNNTYRVFEISGTDTDATINGVKVANANNIFGAILVNGNATLDLNNSTVSNSSGSVGGIFNRGTLTLTNSTVSDNNGSSAGGGLYNSGTLNLNNSIVSNNTAYNYQASSYGGGIFNTGNLNINNSTFANNRATSGAFGRNAPPLLPATYGGSIYNSGIVNITNSTVSDSSAESGGGIYNAGNLNTINTTVSTNKASYGGGIGNQGTLTVSNSTVTNNSAFQYQSSYFSIDPNGGGIFNTADGIAIIGNTLIAGNFDLDLPYGEFNPDVVGDFNDLGNNLIGDSTGSTGFTTSTLVGTSTNPINPKLSPLQNNGGATLTHALLTDSLAINTGNNTLIPAEITTDQRGADFNRISGGTVDIGAFEFPSSNTILYQVSITAINTSADENTRSTGSYRISRNDSSGTLVVYFTLSGDASLADYQLSVAGNIINTNNVVFFDGQSYVDITLTAIDDIATEAAESLTITLADSSAYQIDTAHNSATVTIAANDTVVTNTNDAGEGSLRQAILNANAFAGEDTITFDGEFTDDTPDTITLTSGQLAITDDLTILGTGASRLTVSGNNTSSVFETLETGTDVTIDGLTIANGTNYNYGGIRVNSDTTLSLTNSNVTRNTSDNYGGGIHNYGTLNLTNTVVSGNNALSGAGIFNRGSLSLNKSTIFGNTAKDTGGGIYNNNIGILQLTNSTVSNNTANFGGGIINDGDINLTNSTVSDNTANYSGGGISNGNYRGGSATLINSTVSGNRARNEGGGISNANTLTLSNTTVTNNTADFGGGVFNYYDSTVTVGNTIIAGNFKVGDSEIYTDVAGNFNDLGNNLIGDNTGSRGFTTSTLVGTSINPINPQLGLLQNNGGVTLTHALEAGSLAINAGNNALVPVDVTTDQRGIGFDRISGNTVDIGAYEIVPIISIIATDNTADENSGATGTYRLSRSNSVGALNINFTLSGDASLADYALSIAGNPVSDNSILFADGQSYVDIILTAINDIQAEAAENLTFSLTADSAYLIDSDNSTATVTIAANDTVVTNTNDAGEGSLRQAILNANAFAGEDIVTFDGEFTDDTPDTITLTSGQLTITDDLNLLGSSTSKLTVSGNYTSRIFEISGTGTDVTIDHLTITGGGSEYLNNNSGGGILVNRNSTLTLNNSIVSQNFAISGNGGGILNEGSLTLNNTTVSMNNLSGGNGGGISNQGILTLTNSTVSGNNAYTGAGGGGIHNTGTVTLNNSAVSGNYEEYGEGGGGILNSGIFTVTNSTISGNRASFGSGAGISNLGTFILTNSTVSGNTADFSGGGIANSGSLTLNNTTITNNTASQFPYFPGAGNGGGIANFSDGTVNVANTIIAGNFDLPDGDINPDVVGDFNDLGNNLIGDSTGSTGFTTSTLVGTSTNPIDPKLGPLQNNGGTTLTHALLTNSLAINAGNNALIPTEITTDQRGAGFGRISGGTVDIGAYEFPSSGRNLTGTSGDDTLDGSNDDDTINGKAGNDTITGKQGDDSLTGGGGQDRFIYNLGDGIDTITDFGGVGTIFDAPATVIAEVDTIKFHGAGLTARNLLLAQNGSNVEITFEGVADVKIILENFTLENLDNFPASQTRGAIGNILFDGQTSFTNSYDVFDTYSTQGTLYNKNIVTFLNDRNNNVKGFNNSNDVINGLGGDDNIDGKSGNDLLRGGAGNDTLNGGKGNDILIGGAGNDTLIGGEGNDQFVYQTLSDRSTNGDTIKDFDRRHDQLILTDLFKSLGYSGSNPISDGYLRFVQLGAATQVQVDQNGDADNFNTLVTLNKFTATNLVLGTNVLV